MILAHVAGVPVEELLPFLLVSGAGLLAWLRMGVARLLGRYSQRARTARSSSSTTAI